MKTSKIKKICSVVMAAMLGVSVLTGCGSSNSSSSTGASGQEMTFNLGADIKTLDPALNQAVDGGILLVNLFEGLYKLDENQKAIPGVAEKCDISEDGKVYTFHLRSDAKWTNGDPITAGDFEYAWKRVMNPETAAEYAYQMEYIKGAKEYTAGKGSADEVGVKAVDDKTLEVTLTAPCAYFLELTAFPCYFPVEKKTVEANEQWANSAATYVSNGPFKLTDYKIKDQVVLEKNENYYSNDTVKLDKINVKFVADETSAWASYKAGQFDMVYIVPQSEVQAAAKDGTAQIYPFLSNYYLSINMTDSMKEIDPEAAKALSNPKVRQALNLAIDRDSLVENVTKGGQVGAHSFVPTGIKQQDGQDFASKKYFDAKGNVEEAKKLLAEAGYPDGQGFPSVTILYNPEKGHGTVMQAVQDMWKTNLGIDVQLQSQEWKVFIATRNQKDYEIARDGWGADYVDPMTFLDMLQTTSGQNNSGYSNQEYDKIINEAKAEQDATKRFELFRQAEDILMEDMPVIPLYYDTQPMGVKNYIKDLNVSPLGFIYFDKAYIEGK
ncbi:peptide ABC transporter substrate-binding protein [Clostridium butyricum]|uniref:Peptide ABC transporter substrate-binding protein n=1 Tax=Clostridium butyricum TaxID=1492 RepID=A0A512TPK7_CLOBU|nr:peptide ABC transporter substrate-binding protein [Clostridium butyricum]MDU1507032.1 peptide ABC transporter substrate-binding protein [Clostridium butyricum]NOW21428.1 oligopeptide transport system substrate-binding protein [Clostridium butyricum]GEQ22177.1 peptide ABC transporter substrate-binding protein [Clostridium butyricum]